MNSQSKDEFDCLRERIAARPTDLQLRFELGRALFQRQDYASAMPELQTAMAHPQFRREAGELLARSFDARGMPDMATRLRRHISGESDGGSASIPIPISPRPPTLPDASAAVDIPHDDGNA
jgi:Tetratricopeptide repeat